MAKVLKKSQQITSFDGFALEKQCIGVGLRDGSVCVYELDPEDDEFQLIYESKVARHPITALKVIHGQDFHLIAGDSNGEVHFINNKVVSSRHQLPSAIVNLQYDQHQVIAADALHLVCSLTRYEMNWILRTIDFQCDRPNDEYEIYSVRKSHHVQFVCPMRFGPTPEATALDCLFFSTGERTVYCVHERTELGQLHFSTPIVAAARLSDNEVLFGGSDGWVWKVSRSNETLFTSVRHVNVGFPITQLLPLKNSSSKTWVCAGESDKLGVYADEKQLQMLTLDERPQAVRLGSPTNVSSLGIWTLKDGVVKYYTFENVLE